MKGSLSILLSILMLSTALAGCASNDSISQTNEDVDELQKNQDEMTQLLEALINENIALRNDLDALNNTSNSMMIQIDELVQEREELLSQISSSDYNNSALYNIMIDQTLELAALQALLESEGEAIESLDNALESTKQSLQELSDKVILYRPLPNVDCPTISNGITVISGFDDGSGKGEENDGVLHLDEAKHSFSFCNTVFERLTDNQVLPPGSSGLTWIIELDEVVLFTGNNGSTGLELWVSDATKEGTQLVKDIFPGVYSSGLIDPVRFGEGILFAASNGINGSELWYSDGTEEGTYMVKDINPGYARGLLSSSVNGYSSLITESRSGAYFRATNGVNGTELWFTDGTEEGTNMVSDINPGASESIPSSLMTIADIVYFSANNGVNGTELWRSDGTVQGTSMIMDINPGSPSSDPSQITEAGGMIYFSANDGIVGQELWKTTGIESTTVLVKDIREPTDFAGGANYGSYPSDLIEFNDKLYFAAGSYRDDWEISTIELWTSSGTNETTYRVGEDEEWFGYPQTITPYGDELFMSISTVVASAWRNYTSCIWEGNSEQVANGFDDLWYCTNPLFEHWSDENVSEIEDRWNYCEYNDMNGEWYCTDFIDQNPENEFLYNQEKHIEFDFWGNFDTGHEPALSDGTLDGTYIITEVAPWTFNGEIWFNANSMNYGAMESDPEVLGDVIYFFGWTPWNYWELFRTDGSADGTMLVKDLYPGYFESDWPTSLTTLEHMDSVVWFGDDPEFGVQLRLYYEGTGSYY
jgi:ELWxxDGT repeat protein